MRKLIVFLGLVFLCTNKLHADISSVLQSICSNVDCLNNFTGKTGWSFTRHQEYTGGFTDLEQNWYLSPAPGFDVPIGNGASVGTPLIDVNVLLKIGQLASDKIVSVHALVNSNPFINGVLGALTIGESGGYDASATNQGKFFDITWVGATFKWGPSATPPATPVTMPTTTPGGFL